MDHFIRRIDRKNGMTKRCKPYAVTSIAAPDVKHSERLTAQADIGNVPVRYFGAYDAPRRIQMIEITIHHCGVGKVAKNF
jgi:hypothetical protein